MNAKPEKNAEQVEIVYDEQCPVCRLYCHSFTPDNDTTGLRLTDARKGGPIMREVNRHGFDIDDGMVVKAADGSYHYGSEAMYLLAQLNKKRGWTGFVNRSFFGTRALSRLFYPAGKLARNIVLRLKGIEKIHNLKPENTLKHQLGENWDKLHPAIRTRFNREPAAGEEIVYEGVMHTVRRSLAGRLFAELTRMIGNPLTPFQGTDVPMTVTLYKIPGKHGVFWRRTYHFSDRKPYTVTSVKCESKQGEMLECVGGGFGMKLHVFAEEEKLHFTSTRYFWTFLQYRIPLPHLVTPGETRVIHEDLGGGDFRFTISMRHPLLGETFFQDGVFRLQQAKE